MDKTHETITETENIKNATLKVTIAKGINISKRKSSIPSSYVRLYICGTNETTKTTQRSFKSKVCKKNSNPSWNFEITSEVDPEEDVIIVKVYLKRKLLPDERIGRIHLHLSQLKTQNKSSTSPGDSLVFDLCSSGGSTGINSSSIHVYFSYFDQRTIPSIEKVEAETKVPAALKYKLLQPEGGQEPLPPGWVMYATPEGKVFFLNHEKKITTWRDPRIKAEEDLLGPLPENWEEMANEDGSLFYVDHSTKTTQWEDPRLAQFDGPEVLYSIEFKEKLESFIRSLGVVLGILRLKVRRENIFKDSYRRITGKDGLDLRQKLYVKFVTEEGLDAGGVAREWFYLLSKQMFDAQYGLFEYSSSKSCAMQINPSSHLVTSCHLPLFQFVGKICAMAIYHRKLIEVTFTRVFYKMMLSEEINLEDIKDDDEEYYNSLRWILDNDPEGLDLTFTTTEESMGQKMDKLLKPGGDCIKINNENKEEYVELVLKWKFVSRVEGQMEAFMKGFSEVLSITAIKIFSPQELKLLLAGLPHISVSNWKQNTKYKGAYFAHHPVMLRFWKVVYLMTQEERSALLRFVTGMPRIPMNGFAELSSSDSGQPFTIEDWGDCSQLPLARTCFNRLYLPPYATYEEMRDKLRCAMENSDCFDGVD